MLNRQWTDFKMPYSLIMTVLTEHTEAFQFYQYMPFVIEILSIFVLCNNSPIVNMLDISVHIHVGNHPLTVILTIASHREIPRMAMLHAPACYMLHLQL